MRGSSSGRGSSVAECNDSLTYTDCMTQQYEKELVENLATLVAMRKSFEDEILASARKMIEAGAPIQVVADLIGVHRVTLWRQLKNVEPSQPEPTSPSESFDFHEW